MTPQFSGVKRPRSVELALIFEIFLFDSCKRVVCRKEMRYWPKSLISLPPTNQAPLLLSDEYCGGIFDALAVRPTVFLHDGHHFFVMFLARPITLEFEQYL